MLNLRRKDRDYRISLQKNSPQPGIKPLASKTVTISSRSQSLHTLTYPDMQIHALFCLEKPQRWNREAQLISYVNQ